MEDRVSHWLTRTNVTRVPRRIVCIDSEAKQIHSGKTTEHTFRLGSASFDILDKHHCPTRNTKRADFATPLELWQWVTDCTAAASRTMVFAHNIGYDLRLTGGLEHLPALGYELRGVALTSYSCWARFANGNRGITLADTSSWVNKPLAGIAADLRVPHRDMPPWNAGDDIWLERCKSDVEALRAFVFHIIRFVVDENLGDLRLTGAAQSSAVFRRRFLKPSQLLVHDDQEALTAERRAAWTGRCELWRHGKIDTAVFEYDFDSAYCRIAATDTVPGRLLGGHSPLTGQRFTAARSEMAILSECEVTTEIPTVPAEIEGAIVWPVGTFRTILWDSELQLAIDNGATVNTEWCYLYEKTDALQEWARWILACLDGMPPGDDPIVRQIVKGWSRSLIGRFGLRYQDLYEIAKTNDSKVTMYPVMIGETGEAETWLQIGRQLYSRTGFVETADSLPQITSYVMSRARCNLWEAMSTFGLSRILYVDTDGFLSLESPSHMRHHSDVFTEFPDLRRKNTYQGATLRSPRNLDVGNERRIAGVPRKAAQVGPSSFEYEAWETLPGALRRSRSDRVIVTERRADLGNHDPRRAHLPGGMTAPMRLAVIDGVNRLLD